MEKCGSILDYVRSGLDPAVWGQDGHLLPEHKQQIAEILASFLSSVGFKAADSWIKDVKIIGSLTTYQYISTTDVDIHIPVDLKAFIASENPYITEQEANDLLDAIRKKFNPEKTTLTNTKHPLELYFETDINMKKTPSRTGAYSLLDNKWILPPVSVDMDFDIEDLNPIFIDLAEQLASELDVDLGKLKRDVLRAEELVDVIKAWEPETQTKFRAKLDERLTSIEQEIRDLVQKKDDIADARHDYDPVSEQEIKFKYIQRFGYFAIIAALKEFLKDDGVITEDELPAIEKVLDKNASAYDYSSVQINIPKDTFAQVVEWGKKNIPEEDIYEGTGEDADKFGREDNGHVTVLYGLHTNKFSDVKKYFEDTKEIHLSFGEIGFFSNEDKPYDVVMVEVESEDLHKLNGILKKNLEYTTEFPKYEPHMTIAYVKKGKAKKYKGKTLVDGDIVVDDVVFSPAKGDKESFPLKKEAASKPRVVAVETMTIGGNTVKIIVGQDELDAYLQSIKNAMDADGDYAFEADSARQSAHDAALESALNLTDFKGQDPYLYAAHVRDAISRFAEEMFDEKYANLDYTAEFTPSMSAMPPNSVGPDNVVTPIDPDPMSDETTHHNPIVNKPREKGGFWRSLLDWFVKKKQTTAAWSYAERAAWIAPDAQVYPVEYSHVDWYLANKKMLKEKYNFVLTDKEEQQDDPVNWLIQNDWIRLAFATQNSREVGLQVADINNLPAFLEDKIWEFNPKKLYIEDAMGNDVVLDETALHRGLSKSLQKYRQKAASFSLQYWLDPNGQEYEGDALKEEGVAPEKLVRSGWVQVLVPSDRQGIVLVVDELEFAPDFLNPFLSKTVGYGDPVTVKDSKGSTLTLRYPFKNIRGLIKKHLYAPEQEVSAKVAGYGGTQSYWISPDGEVHDASPSHADWAFDNADDLAANYGINLIVPESTTDLEDQEVQSMYSEILDTLIGADWVRVFIHDKDMAIQIADLSNPPSSANDFFAMEQSKYNSIVVGDNQGDSVSLPKTDETLHDAILNARKFSQRAASLKFAGVARCWISPTGKVYPVKDTHSEWMEQNQTILKRDYNLSMKQIMDAYYDEETESYSATSVEMSNQLVALGWSRIGDVFNTLEIGVQVPSLHEINTHVFDYLISSLPDKAKIIIEDLDENFVDVTKEDLLDGQEGINRAMKIGHARKAANLKFAETNGYWLSPDGKEIKLGPSQEHAKVIKQYGLTFPDAIIKNGWVRIRMDGDQAYVEVQDIRNIPPEVEAFFIHHPADVLFIEEPYNRAYVSVEMNNVLESSLQEEVNHQLKRRRAASIKVASVESEILKLIESTGGATYSLEKGNLAGTNMYAVSIYPERSVILDHTPTEAEIYAYIADNKDLIGGENSFGAWSNNGKTYLDIIVTLEDREQAIELGKKHNQIAIFDLKNFQEISTGGTGEVVSKQAKSIEDVHGVKVWVNPTPTEVKTLLKKSREQALRALIDPATGDVYVWDAYLAEHDRMIRYFGLDIDWEGDDGTSIRHVSPATPDADIGYLFEEQAEIKKKIKPFLESGYYGPEDGSPKEYYTHNTDEKNLGNPNQRFMGRPKGPNRSNQEEVIQMIFDKPLSRRQAELGKEAFTLNGFWVAPDGKAFDVRKSGSHTHGDWVVKNANILAKYGIKDAKKRDYFEVATEMLQKGWARVGDSARNKFAAIGVEINNIKAIPSGVDNVLAEFLQDGDVIIVADLNGDWVEVNYPFKSLQNAVNKARMGRRATADYSQEQQEAIFVEQHEFNDNSGLATTPHDFTNSSSDYPSPKDLQPVQVFLDKLDKSKTPPIPSYEVSWAISQPKE